MGEATAAMAITVLADVGGSQFHVGDEAMLAANVAMLEQHAPHVTLTVLGRDAPADAGLRTTDGLFVSGGGNLSASWPALLEQRVALIEAAGRGGIPVVLGGQTVGPEIGEGRGRLGAALATAALVGVRERDSVLLAIELGVDVERLVYQVDDSFELAGASPEAPALRSVCAANYLAVTLDGSYAAGPELGGLRSLAQQVCVLAGELRLPVVFVPHVGVLGETEGEDVVVGRAFCALLRLAGVRCLLAPVPGVEEAVWLAQHAALTISSRYHPLVFASAAHRPCLGLYRDRYTQIKLRGALSHVGAERYCLATAAAERGGLVTAARELWGRRDAVSERMARALPGIAARQAARRERILAALGARRSPAPSGEGEVLGWSARDLALTTIGRMLDHDPPDGRPSAFAIDGPLAAPTLSDEQWDRFSRDGFLPLGRVLDAEAVDRLTQRADDLAMGRVANDHVQMQLDTGGAYEDLPEAVDAFEEPTQFYRKIQGLEMDDEFVSLVGHPRFIEVSRRIYGPHVPLSIFRAMIMNKPAGQGTVLPWHQDGGDVWALDREPLVTIWVALDPATTANGCMEAVRGSHRLGLLSDYGSTVSDEDAARHCPPGSVVPLEVEPGHAVLLHNWLIHRSGVNPSTTPRRAVTICYLDGRTRSVMTGDHLPLVAGTVDPAPHHYVEALATETAALRETATRGEEYARSLETALAAAQAGRQEAERYAQGLEAGRQEAERYAQSLEAERTQASAAAPAGPPARAAAPVRRGWRDRLRAGADGP